MAIRLPCTRPASSEWISEKTSINKITLPKKESVGAWMHDHLDSSSNLTALNAQITLRMTRTWQSGVSKTTTIPFRNGILRRHEPKLRISLQSLHLKQKLQTTDHCSETGELLNLRSNKALMWNRTRRLRFWMKLKTRLNHLNQILQRRSACNRCCHTTRSTQSRKVTSTRRKTRHSMKSREISTKAQSLLPLECPTRS